MTTWFRVVLGVLGVAIAAVALIINIKFYSSYGTDADTQWIFTALAVISLAIKLAAPAAASYSPSKLAAVCLWISFIAAVAFDSLGTAGYVEMTYGTKTGQASRYADEYKRAGENVSKLETEYKVYATERPTPEIVAALDAAKAVAGKCTPRRAHLDACTKIATLEQELARADERDKRESLWREAKAKFDKLDKPKLAADPQGAVFERLGSRIGLGGLKSFVALIISILIFAFFELGGPALVYVALHGQGERRANKQSGAHEPAPSRAAGRQRAAKGAPASNVGVLEQLKALAATGGVGLTTGPNQISGSQRALGEACGVSGAKMNRILAELQAAGSIALRTGPNGTVIRILGV